MFFEEARELLISLEEGLMELERRQGDRAHLDRTFRAAHSIKGAAAMVGLAALAEFTHGIEAVLDRIRAGVLKVDSDIITTLLEARDHLGSLVEAEAAKSPIPASAELNARLAALLLDVRPSAPTAPPPPPPAPPSPPPVAQQPPPPSADPAPAEKPPSRPKKVAGEASDKAKKARPPRGKKGAT